MAEILEFLTKSTQMLNSKVTESVKLALNWNLHPKPNVGIEVT